MLLGKRIKKAGLGILLAAFLLCTFEGLLSFALLTGAVGRSFSSQIAERKHTRFDAELGWINTPNTRITNMYGDGAHLTINGQGFRSKIDFTTLVPPGRVRIVCSGDSFTLGYGVDDSHTWAHLLEILEPRLQTVNMGQGGYGVDQAYLWYRRVESDLEHHIHLFSFIEQDFARLRQSTFSGYGKPLLSLDADELNVAEAQRPSPLMRLRPRGARKAFERLALVHTLKLVLPNAAPGAGATKLSTSESELVVEAIFADLKVRNDAAERELVLVYLPIRNDVGVLRPWRSFTKRAADRLQIPFLDATDAMLNLSNKELDSLFIAESELPYHGAAGHYSANGNDLVARWLYEQLRTMPAVAARIRAAQQTAAPQ